MDRFEAIRVEVIGASTENCGKGEAIGSSCRAEQVGEERECVGELAGSSLRADEGVVKDNGLLGLGLVEERAGGEEVIVSGVGVC